MIGGSCSKLETNSSKKEQPNIHLSLPGSLKAAQLNACLQYLEGLHYKWYMVYTAANTVSTYIRVAPAAGLRTLCAEGGLTLSLFALFSWFSFVAPIPPFSTTVTDVLLFFTLASSHSNTRLSVGNIIIAHRTV